MENFIVSARKYRPATFSTVVGQQSITSTLKNAIERKKLAHAYLFCGPRGVGKTTCARIFAKTINCQNITPQLEACNACESCSSFNESRSYNIHELDAASNNSVEDIRNLIEQVRIPPQIGKYSVYIIDEVHMLSAAAFNAFLKTLEEPPPHAIFVLATTEKHKILPTILSRCQIFDFNRITVEDIAGHLSYVANEEDVEAEDDGLNVIAQKADGAMRDALSLFDQIVSFSGGKLTYKKVIENLNVLDYDYYFRLTEAFLQGNISEALVIFDTILDKGFDGHHFINGLSKHLRDLMVCKDEATVELLEVGAAIGEKYREQAKQCNVGFLFEALSITNKCDLNYKISNNQRLHVEITLMQLCNILKKIEQQAVLQQQKAQQTQGTAQTAQPATSQQNTPPPKKKKNKISISAALNGDSPKQQPQQQQQQQPTTEPTQDLQTANFTQQQAENAWKAFANTKTTERRLFSMLTSHLPLLKDNFVLEIQLTNSLQQNALENIRAELLQFMRQQLNNAKVEMTVVVKAPKKAKRPYTNTDKFNYLNSKNNNLAKLKQQFNLDFT